MEGLGLSEPRLSVVVPSHDRPLRLRWLLNALEEQTLPRDRWEIVVAHDSVGPETDELLSMHPLAQDGTLRFGAATVGIAHGKSPASASLSGRVRAAGSVRPLPSRAGRSRLPGARPRP